MLFSESDLSLPQLRPGVTIAKIFYNVLETPKNENNMLKTEDLREKLKV